MVEMDYDNNFDSPAGVEHAPVAQPAELPEIKLFGRWSCDDVQVSDMSLQVRIGQFRIFIYIYDL